MGIWDSIKSGWDTVKNKAKNADYGAIFDWGKNEQLRDPALAQVADANRMRDYMWQQLGGLGGRQAPQVGGAQIATGPQSQVRAQEMALAGQLGRVATGQEKGAGELAVGRQFQQGLAAQMAMQRGVRGGNAGSAGLAAARNAGNMTVDAAGQSQMAALQDQTQARGLLAGLLGQVRGADLGLASSQAGFDQQAALANQEAQLRQMGLNDQQIATILGQMGNLGLGEANLRLQQQGYISQDQGYFPSLLQQAGNLGGSAIMASDRNLKTDIEPAADDIDEFLDKLTPSTWRYTDERLGKGRFAGVMAQDVEKSKIGKDIVVEAEEGKGLQSNKVMSALLASVARLNKRVRDVEGK